MYELNLEMQRLASEIWKLILETHRLTLEFDNASLLSKMYYTYQELYNSAENSLQLFALLVF